MERLVIVIMINVIVTCLFMLFATIALISGAVDAHQLVAILIFGVAGYLVSRQFCKLMGVAR